MSSATSVIATALDAVRATAAGYELLILSSRLREEARKVAKSLVAVGEEAAVTSTPVELPAAIFAEGETTVTVNGDGGSSGLNLELELSGIPKFETISFLRL